MKGLLRCLALTLLLTGITCSAAETSYRPEIVSPSRVTIEGRAAYGYDDNRQMPQQVDGGESPAYIRRSDYLTDDTLTDTEAALRQKVAALLLAGAPADRSHLLEKHNLAEAVEELMASDLSFEEPPTLEAVAHSVTQHALWGLLDSERRPEHDEAVRRYGDAFWAYYQELGQIAEKGQLPSTALAIRTTDGSKPKFYWDGSGYSTTLLYAASETGGEIEVAGLPEGMRVVDEDGTPFEGAVPVGTPFALRSDRELHQPLLLRVRHRYEEVQIWFYRCQSESDAARFQELIAIDTAAQSVVAFRELTVAPPDTPPSTTTTSPSASVPAPIVTSPSQPSLPSDTDTGEETVVWPLLLLVLSTGIMASYFVYFAKKIHNSRKNNENSY